MFFKVSLSLRQRMRLSQLGEAYLSFPATVAKTLQASLPLVPVTDGITNVTDNVRTGYYTVSGIKVDKPVKGVYIHNGKKIMGK